MRQHRLDYYLDNRVRVAFCKDCGAEGELLLSECPGKLSVDKKVDGQRDFFAKEVDNDKKPS